MKQHHPSLDTPDEGYFASFTDMLVGIIFIFIILLMIVANDYQSATESITKISKDLDEARNEARDRQRDVARDRARDEARDKERDASRDQVRDDTRDRERDAAHDRAIAEAQALKEWEAREEAKTKADQNAKNSEARANDEANNNRLRAIQQNLFNDSRGKILLKIQQLLNMQGYAVVANVNQGTLTIPEKVLFYPNQGDVNYTGKQAINSLANSFSKYLPCVSPTADSNRLIECGNLGFPPNDGLDVIFIDDYPDISGSREDKLLLAVQHIVSIFNELKAAEPYLDEGLKNKFGVPILNVKVNQERRNARNRQQNYPAVKNSVVLRFIMRQPNQEDIMKLRNSDGSDSNIFNDNR